MNRIIKYAVVVAAAICILPATAQKKDFELSKSMELMLNYMHALHSFHVDKIDVEDMMLRGADGMTSNLDPYTSFMPEKEVLDFKARTTGRYGGVGAVIRKKGDYPIFAEPYKGSPADRAGIIIGDKIIAIDGQSTKSLTIDKVSDHLRGEPNTTVNVTIERLLDGKQTTLKIRRERIVIPSIPYYGFATDGVGYIRHTDFTSNCYDDMRNAIIELQKSGKLESLILDYRNNGGGVLQSAVDILSLFLPKGTKVVEMKERDGKSVSFQTKYEPLLPDTPITILVNRGTASAAEIVSGALQDLDRGVVVGERSFGKGLVQTTYPLGYNSYAKITTGRYYIPSGRCIQAVRYNNEGQAEQVPDSLVNEFRTKAGRKVYDGGGIMPDVKVEEEYVSNFLTVLYVMDIIEDYVNNYYKKHHTEQIDVRNFSISEADYADFMALVEQREIPYKSESRTALETLRKALKRERQSVSEEALKAVEQALKDDKRNNLITFRKEITLTINSYIVQRYAYTRGVIEHSLTTDKVVRQALDVLGDKELYTKITTQQDTTRK